MIMFIILCYREKVEELRVNVLGFLDLEKIFKRFIYLGELNLLSRRNFKSLEVRFYYIRFDLR